MIWKVFFDFVWFVSFSVSQVFVCIFWKVFFDFVPQVFVSVCVRIKFDLRRWKQTITAASCNTIWPTRTLIASCPTLFIQNTARPHYHYNCYIPVITASRVWVWDSNPALPHKSPILSQFVLSLMVNAPTHTAMIPAARRNYVWSIFHATSDHRAPFFINF